VFDEGESFVPPLLPNGFYNQQKEKYDKIMTEKKLIQERKDRIQRRQSICELCDNALITGRTVLKNEEKSAALKREKGLVLLAKMTCNTIIQNYKVEVPWLNCDHVVDQMKNFYNGKYTGNVQVPPNCKGDCPEIKEVNFGLIASLQSCQTMIGVTFCDAQDPNDSNVEKVKEEESVLQPVQVQLPPPNPPVDPSPLLPIPTKKPRPHFGIPPKPVVPAPTTPKQSVSIQPGPVVQPLESLCDCECCGKKEIYDSPPCDDDPCSLTTKPAAPPLTTPEQKAPVQAGPVVQSSETSCECECCKEKVVYNPPPCDDDPCNEQSVSADLIFRVAGVDSGALTNDIKQSIIHLFSAMLMIDDSQITLEDLGNTKFNLASTKHAPAPTTPTEVVPPTEQAVPQVTQVAPATRSVISAPALQVLPNVLPDAKHTAEPIIVNLPSNLVYQQETITRRRRLVWDLTATRPVKSAIPVETSPDPPELQKTLEKEKQLTLRIIVACTSNDDREEIIARYESLCTAKDKMKSAINLVLSNRVDETSCPQVKEEEEEEKDEHEDPENQALEDDDSDQSTVGTKMKEYDTIEEESEEGITKKIKKVSKNEKKKSSAKRNLSKKKREPIGPLLTGSQAPPPKATPPTAISATGSEGKKKSDEEDDNVDEFEDDKSKETNEDANTNKVATLVLNEVKVSIKEMKKDIAKKANKANTLPDGDERQLLNEEILAARRRLRLSEDDVKELSSELKDTASVSATGSSATGSSATGSSATGSSATSGNEKNEKNDELNDNKERGEMNVEKEEEELAEEATTLEKEEKEQEDSEKITDGAEEDEDDEGEEEETAANEVEENNPVKFKAKRPTTLLHRLRGSQQIPTRESPNYSIMPGDDNGRVSLDAVLQDLERQGYHSSREQSS
jgi:hypothetical protein